MNAIELADELINWYPKVNLCVASAIMLRQQAKEIEILNQSYELLFKHRIEQEKEVIKLKAELEDCTCQGGHSEAYLKAKGRL